MLLTEIKKQQNFFIKEINTNNNISTQLLNLGLIRNIQIKVMQNMKGNMIIALGNTRISISKDAACLIKGEACEF